MKKIRSILIDSDEMPPEALKRKHRLEQDASFRTDHMKYMEGMQVIESDIKDKVLGCQESIRLRAVHGFGCGARSLRGELFHRGFPGAAVPGSRSLSGADGEKSRGDHEESFR